MAVWFQQDRWEAGLTMEDYINQMPVGQAAMRRRATGIRMTPYERNQFSALKDTIYALALTDVLCMECLMNLPILAQMEISSSGLQVRVFPVSSNPDLVAEYSRRGITDLPVFTFFDEKFEEIGTWNHQPQAAELRWKNWKQDYPQAAEACDSEISPEEKYAALEDPRDAMEDSYDLGLQLETVTELRRLLRAYLPD